MPKGYPHRVMRPSKRDDSNRTDTYTTAISPYDPNCLMFGVGRFTSAYSRRSSHEVARPMRAWRIDPITGERTLMPGV